MRMYYRPWCFKCEKPQVRLIKELSLLPMLYYLEEMRPGIKQRVWEFHSDSVRNDISVYLCFDIQEYTWDGKCELNEDLKKDFELIAKEFPEALESDINFHISW